MSSTRPTSVCTSKALPPAEVISRLPRLAGNAAVGDDHIALHPYRTTWPAIGLLDRERSRVRFFLKPCHGCRVTRPFFFQVAFCALVEAFFRGLYRGECRNIAQIDKPLQGLDRHRRLFFFFHRLEQAELKAIVDSTRADIVVVG